ncbi:hypothetical protein MRB53_039574 [Persea americana]|nr:hypothetical protein MRB53_039574 [Persea americana]
MATPPISPTSGKAPQRRQRAPTITIDTSAVRRSQDGTEAADEHDPSRLSDQTARLSADDSRESRPTSPHNVSSPTQTSNTGLLSVPSQQRKRGGSVDTDSGESFSTTDSTYVGSDQRNSDAFRSSSEQPQLGAGGHPVLSDDEALVPDPGTEADFQRENNPFAFTPGQLSKMLNPKSLGAFHALGGLQGLVKGLRTDLNTGLSTDEKDVTGSVSFEEATTAPPKAVQDYGTPLEVVKTQDGSNSAQTFQDRKRIFNDNLLPERKANSIWKLAWIAYNDKVLILLTVAAIIALVLGIYQSVAPAPPTGGEQNGSDGHGVEWVEGVAIIVAILIVVIVGAINDWQKERQFVKLNKKKEDRNVKVVRSGVTQEISVHDLLVGDILLVEPGDILAVDGILIAGHGVRCDESSATGESDLLKKSAGDEVYRAMEENQSLRKMDPFMISGAKVTEGVGRMLVIATGIHSSYGKTMLSLRDENEATPLQLKLNKLAGYIAKLGGASAGILFLVLFIEFLVKLRTDPGTSLEKGREFINILIIAVTIVVVAVPEGLPLAVTLALAFATRRMLQDNNLVRVLRSCETMGNATCICSDKTGTLTQNVMTVVAGSIGTSSKFNNKSIESESQETSAADCIKTLSEPARELLKDSIAINSTAFEGEEDGKQVFIGSKTETALLTLAKDLLGMDKISIERSNVQTVQLIPFDSSRKCMGTVIKLKNGGYRLLVKGASEIMLEKCSNIVTEPTKNISSAPLSATQHESLTHLIDEYASRSLRTLGFIYKDFQEWPPRHARRLEDDRNAAVFEDVCKSMTFLGLVGIQDPLRPGVAESVADCLLAGVFPRMVTGDNINTAKAIATECGIFTPGGLAIEGPAFRKMDREEQNRIIPKLQVLARSSPEDKRVLVKRLKDMGETVAVTGDGTNDAPALKAADIGFSMNIAGTEVAKEASDIILMDDNFSSIVKALLWGRAVNDSVRKFLQFQITVNITAVLLAFITAVASPDQQSVLTAVQLLWVNLIMDTMAALALATDPPTRELLNRKPDPKSAGLFTTTMWKMIIGQAIYQLVVTLVLYFAGVRIFGWSSGSGQTTVFNTFVWMQIFNSLNNRRLDNHFNVLSGIQRNFFFIAIFLIMIGGQTLIVFVGGAVFNIVGQQAYQWGVALVLGALSIPFGVLIRLVPDPFVVRLYNMMLKLIPSFIREWFASRKKRDKIVITDEENPMQWNEALIEIRDELAWIKRYKGGRLNNLVYRVRHPSQIFSSRSPSRSRSSLDAPSTPGQRPSTDIDKDSFNYPSTPSSKKRGRSRSNSTLAAAAMSGIVAGSIGGWSPIERHDVPSRARSRSDLSREVQQSFEMHPGTKNEDQAVTSSKNELEVPPSQSTKTTPTFGSGPFGGEASTQKDNDKQ